jgi:outer membrane protein TolC
MQQKFGWMSVMLVLASGAVQAEELTLRQCVNIALTQNPELLASQARIDQAQAAINQAQSSYLPKITTSITASRSNDPLNVFGMKLMQQSATFNDFGAGEFNPANPNVLSIKPNNLNHPADYTNVNTRLQAEMPLYTGGQIDAYVRQAQAYLSAAQAGDVAARQQLTFMVFQAYEGVTAAGAYVDVADQGVKAAESFVKTAENLTKQGVMVKSELLTAKVHLSNVQLQREQARNQQAIALEQLKMLMGKPLDASVALVKGVGIESCECDLPRVKEKALAQNPQLRALRQQAESTGAALDAASAAYLPTVGLMVRQDWNDNNLALNNSSYTLAGVMNWTITDFGVTKASVDRARATQAEMAAKVKRAEQEIEFKVSEAHKKHQEAQNRVNALALNASQAEEAARLVRQRHEGGVATITEVLVAETQLLKAKADLIAARHEVNTQRGQLRLLVGEFDETIL